MRFEIHLLDHDSFLTLRFTTPLAEQWANRILAAGISEPNPNARSTLLTPFSRASPRCDARSDVQLFTLDSARGVELIKDTRFSFNIRTKLDKLFDPSLIMPLQLTFLQREIKGLCDPRSRFCHIWAPRLLILSMCLSLGWMVALIFLMDDRLDSLEDSTLAKTLQESQVLVMAHCTLVGSAIPMLLDVFLDFIKLKLRKGTTDKVTLDHFRTRALLLLCSLVSTIVFASIRQFGSDADLRRLAFIYVLLNHCFRSIMITMIALLIMTLGVIPNILFLAAFILWYTATPLILIHLLRPERHSKLLLIANSMKAISFLLFAICFFMWARDVWRRYKESRWKSIKMGTTEFICVIYWWERGCSH